MLASMIYSGNAEELVIPFLVFTTIYIGLNAAWTTQWLANCPPDLRLFSSPKLHLLTSLALFLKLISHLIVVTCLMSLLYERGGFDINVSGPIGLLITLAYNVLEGFLFIIVLLACKGWTISRTELLRREKWSIVCVFLLIMVSSVFSLYIAEFYVLWISSIYVVIQRICFLSVEENIHHMHGFQGIVGMHPGVMSIIQHKRDMFASLRLQASAWVVVLALREMFALSIFTSEYAVANWVPVLMYEVTCIWMFATVGFTLRYRTPVALGRVNPTAVRLPVMPVFDNLPKYKNIKTAYYLISTDPLATMGSNTLIATREDEVDSYIERKLRLSTRIPEILSA